MMPNSFGLVGKAKDAVRDVVGRASPDNHKKPKVDEELEPDFDSLGENVPAMFKALFKKMDGVEKNVANLSVAADQAKLKAQQAVAIAEMAESKVGKLEVDMTAMKGDIESMKGDSLKDTINELVKKSVAEIKPKVDLGPAPVVQSRISEARISHVHEKVIVQGWFDHKADTGALGVKARDELASKLLEHIPDEDKNGFKFEQRYNLTRRIVFYLPKGGERCWILREKLIEAIKENNIEVDGKALKVRVQDSPEKEARRGVFWRAVSAMETIVGKDAIILEPRTCVIHAASN